MLEELTKRVFALAGKDVPPTPGKSETLTFDHDICFTAFEHGVVLECPHAASKPRLAIFSTPNGKLVVSAGRAEPPEFEAGDGKSLAEVAVMCARYGHHSTLTGLLLQASGETLWKDFAQPVS